MCMTYCHVNVSCRNVMTYCHDIVKWWRWRTQKQTWKFWTKRNETRARGAREFIFIFGHLLGGGGATPRF